MAKGKGFFGWMLALLTGTLLGVLFSPRKGSDVRKRVKDARKKGQVGHEPLLEDFKDMGDEIAGVARDIYGNEEVQDVVRRGRQKINELGHGFFDEMQDLHELEVEPRVNAAKRKVHRKVKQARKKANHVIKKAKKAQRHVEGVANKMKKHLDL